jgi:hypothetical protein
VRSYTLSRPFAALSRRLTAAVHVPAMNSTRSTLTALAAIAAVAAGCGDDDSKDAAPAEAGPSTSAKTTPPTVPADLLGTYKTTLKPGDIPGNAGPELTQSSRRWKLTLTPSGGLDNGSALTLADARLGVLESSTFVAGDGTIEMPHEECAAGGTEHFFASKYRYALSGRKLTFTKITAGCPDKAAETILTSQPWKRVG